MKFKEQPPKKNKIMMILIIPLLFLVCICWLLLKNYIRFGIYISLTLLILFLYLLTYYYLEDKYLIIKAGIIKIKIKYEDIQEVIEYKEKIVIRLKSINFTLYPDIKEDFIKVLKSKVSKKVNFIVGDTL